jgi:elongation factor Ts
MAEISADLVKSLREQTNAGMMECKRALAEAGGDMAKAVDILRKKGAATALKKSSREAKDGVIASYIHLGGKVGVLIEVNCETDFVAKNEGFREFVKDLTLHIAASNPLYVSREQVPAAIVDKEREIVMSQLAADPKNAKKPAEILEKIVSGRLDKYYTTACLLEQAYIKDPDVTIRDLLTRKVQEIGENLVIRRFVRFQVGEELSA